MAERTLFDSEGPVTQSVEAVRAMCSALGKPIEGEGLPEAVKLGRDVYLVLSNNEDCYYTTTREYGHATGHESRLNRPGIMEVASFGSEDYSFEELVAELTSAYICAKVGIDNPLENSSAYIQNWLQALRNDHTMLLKASGKATAAVEYILANGAHGR